MVGARGVCVLGTMFLEASSRVGHRSLRLGVLVSGLRWVGEMGLRGGLLPFLNFGLCSEEVKLLGVEELPLKVAISVFKCEY